MTDADQAHDADHRVRGGFLLLAFALIGGTGCITATIVNDVQNRNLARKMEEVRRQSEEARARRIAALVPAARDGDLAAMTALAYARLADEGSRPEAVKEALGLLDGASARGHGPAQALLGELQALGFTDVGNLVSMPPALRDREHGIALLRQAATHACRYSPSGYTDFAASSLYTRGSIEPARLLGEVFAKSGNAAEARLWDARSVLHCGRLPVDLWLRTQAHRKPTPETKTTVQALLLLNGTSGPRAKAPAGQAMTAAESQAAAVEREAADLRRQVAESESTYPAPPREALK